MGDPKHPLQGPLADSPLTRDLYPLSLQLQDFLQQLFTHALESVKHGTVEAVLSVDLWLDPFFRLLFQQDFFLR